ncbi:acetyl-CoA carboxylase carboxyltransferase subunit beta [Blautia schinkii]|uniref:acetyl-CoA carboxylase carboxyltransferase subunit alpha n=1 Tax=Blautia schinkii TaxID=180164 RepID=UPI00156F6FC7|nr:acetyl-CoA carboxylase carboxyltransferase subunit alpha [Blautia schinkii]NSG82600.1 acetyl-CoA carboxylase carboxyltransferase subunit beta [Blautia schinkii]NSK23203.1 acetyl-CoA carboxylase carboxyltransferase subunit beta [Blautia schinkii]NSK26243.1 acetyl-CoA carboxylase carboxyltransferase subunit beta [Blautia schinkii]NSK32253.1 acetyl-CoA carboxylase carboxyltransferase subunit beta [Blautia schinkii]NSK49380.1 acetyl-CoA carboxylase carboxyltransferase subunit beta [Blautia schi
MRIKHMFKKTVMDIRGEERENTPEVPDNLMRKCNACKAAVFVDEVKQNHYICPHCGNYFHMPAYRRIKMIADRKSFVEWDAEMEEQNPLQYRGYEEKLRALQEKTGLNEAVVTGKCTIKGISVALGVCDCRFMMSSMGEVVGEKITRVFERATEEKLPVILYICSGGARMQEGLVSLMQMAKTSMALRKHSDAGLLYVPVLTDPTTGGVTASFAMLGDIILAEPKALIGFAGPRVIEQTIGQKLPKGFQKAEFLLEHGFIDKIVERDDQRIVLADILKLHENKGQNSSTSKVAESHISDKSNGNTVWPKFIPSGSFTPWEHVQLARAKTRPTGKDYIEALFDDFIEFHGDRHCGDDAAVIGGVAFFHGHPVTVLAQEKGEGTKENIARNFGMVSPEGYWKSLRLMQQAEKFHRPVICLVDTPGAFCGLEAEERGQGEAIAKNLYTLAGLTVPVLSIVIGEGGSGGALAFAVSDEVWMLEHSVYSILSPEGFASILWKDSKKAKEAAEVMKLTAADLCEMGMIEHVIPETEPVSRENMEDVAGCLENGIADFLEKYSGKEPEELLEHRYQRFRKM